MIRRGDGPDGLSENDLRVLARLEGKPLPRGQALAEALDMRPSAAWDFIRRMRRSGALRLVSPVQAPPDACECISYLRVHAVRADEISALERRMADDPLVMDAAMITGWYDYRLFSRHSDYRSANAWSRSLETAPGVAQVATRMCERVIERPGVVAAILGSG
jgi:DNA-binding Lrp family transcriptional regulator